MNHTIKVFIMLLAGTVVFQTTFTYMAENISDFETVALPPKKIDNYKTLNPTIKIDATARDAWTLVDFSTGHTYQVGDPEREKDKLNLFPWDMGFQRTKIITNSGITNPSGSVGIINLGVVDIDTVVEAPATGYVQDALAWGNVTNKAVGDWYSYRTRTHNVESRKYVYVVRTANNNYMKMKVLNYYCKREKAACASIVCLRSESACWTIEYVLQPDGGRVFPPPPRITRQDRVKREGPKPQTSPKGDTPPGEVPEQMAQTIN